MAVRRTYHPVRRRRRRSVFAFFQPIEGAQRICIAIKCLHLGPTNATKLIFIRARQAAAVSAVSVGNRLALLGSQTFVMTSQYK